MKRVGCHIGSFEDIRGIKLLFKDVVIGWLVGWTTRCTLLDSKADILENTLELWFREEESLPHPRYFSHWISEDDSVGSEAQLAMTPLGRNAENGSHFFLHQLLLLREGVAGTAIVDFGPTDRCDGYDWYWPKVFPDLIEIWTRSIYN